MPFEPVHWVWSFWDRVRSGVADFGGRAHYFDCRFDEAADEYAEVYDLYPVDAEFVARARRVGEIFTAWAERLRRGEASPDSHPALGGLDAEHDALTLWLKGRVDDLEPLPGGYAATFRTVAGQEDLPPGVMGRVEVAWTPALAEG